MRYMSSGRIVELPVNANGEIASKQLRDAAGIPDDRPLIVKMPDGSNKQVNPGEDVMLQPGQEFFDAPVHKRGFQGPDITVPAFATIGRMPASVQTECKSE